MRLLADRFFNAIEETDLPVIETIYAVDAVIWHNYDSVAQSRADNIAVLASFPKLFTEFKYCDINRHFFDDGFVQQHVLRGTAIDGADVALFACMIIAVRGDQIHRIDEYFDTAQVPNAAKARRELLV